MHGVNQCVNPVVPALIPALAAGIDPTWRFGIDPGTFSMDFPGIDPTLDPMCGQDWYRIALGLPGSRALLRSVGESPLLVPISPAGREGQKHVASIASGVQDQAAVSGSPNPDRGAEAGEMSEQRYSALLGAGSGEYLVCGGIKPIKPCLLH